MNDFDRWVLEADRDETLPSPGVFLWSAGTHFLFKRCPRAWYYVHYLAQGGWEWHSREASCHAYMLKHLYTQRSFLEQSTLQTLEKALSETMPIPEKEERAQALKECFQTGMTERYYRAWDDVERARYLRDPKYIYFAELHYDPEQAAHAGEFFHTMLERLREFFRNFERYSVASLLAETDPLYLHKEYIYRTFSYGGSKIVMPPWIYTFTGKELHGWKISFDPADPQTSLTASDRCQPDPERALAEKIFSSWCRVRFGDKVPCFVTTLHQGKNRFSCRTEQIAPLEEDFVDRSSAPILKILHLPGGIRLEHFPVCREKKVCALCRFRALCKV